MLTSSTGGVIHGCLESAGEVEIPNPPQRRKLFVGALAAAENASFLRAHNVTHVLSVAGGRLKVQIGGGDSIAETIDHKTVDVMDHPAANILAVFEQALPFMDAALDPEPSAEITGGNSAALLVHCASGVSRSVSTVVAWLMVRRSLTFEMALTLVRTQRPLANPNFGFHRQLQILEGEIGCINEASSVDGATAASVRQATVRWTQESAKDTMEDVRQQRAAVNELHACVDGLEVEIATLLSGGSGIGELPPEASSGGATERTRLVGMLESLQLKMDTGLPADGSGFVDRPARMILKAATAKTARLLELLR